MMLTSATVVWAQPSNGYIFFSPGGVTCCGHTEATLQFGGGGEAVLGKGIGIGAELSALGLSSAFPDSVVGMFSPNGYYHFIHGKDHGLDPFVTGGYTLMFRSGVANLFNFGGGINYRFRRHLGIRLEFRDHVRMDPVTIHHWGFRVGLVL
jgi:hypothetical protein